MPRGIQRKNKVKCTLSESHHENIQLAFRIFYFIFCGKIKFFRKNLLKTQKTVVKGTVSNYLYYKFNLLQYF